MVAAMDMRKLVGSNCARVRTEKELTQEDLAERSGFSQQYISDLAASAIQQS